MNGFAVLFLVPAAIILLVLVIPVLIGVHVYKDANKLGMQALTWALVAALVPECLGLIAYLIARSILASAKCPDCGTKVRRDYVCCTKCGKPLNTVCGHCGKPVRAEWQACAACGTPRAKISQDTFSFEEDSNSHD